MSRSRQHAFLKTLWSYLFKKSTKPFLTGVGNRSKFLKKHLLDYNNCSLDRIPVESHGYFLGSVEIILTEFVDDIADRISSLLKRTIR